MQEVWGVRISPLRNSLISSQGRTGGSLSGALKNVEKFMSILKAQCGVVFRDFNRQLVNSVILLLQHEGISSDVTRENVSINGCHSSVRSDALFAGLCILLPDVRSCDTGHQSGFSELTFLKCLTWWKQLHLSSVLFVIVLK